MKFPFVTRSHHDEVVSLLRAQLAQAEQERRVYLDRLATAGLGGAFFAAAASTPAAEPEQESEPAAELTPEDRIRAFRRRPSHMSAYVTRQLSKQRTRELDDAARAKHIRTDVEDELDAAEEAGRRQPA